MTRCCQLLALILISIHTTTFSFTTRSTISKINIVLSASKKDNGGGALGKAYNDDALFNFHMMTQQQKIRDYTASDFYIDTKSLWNLAWHDSFVRNGLSDFVPPLTDNLNVLIVGETSDAVEEVPKKDSPAIEGDDTQVIEGDDTQVDREALTEEQQDSSCSFLAAVFDDDENRNEDGYRNRISGGESSSDLAFVTYDCIMDKGLLGDLLSRGDNELDDDRGSADTNNKEEVGRLLWEATKRIKDMGIYTMSTPPLSESTKQYLTELGGILGLQWVFDLDGISDDNLSVSVARYSECLKDEYEFPKGWQSFSKLAKNIKK